jgi:ABC-type multidrug transport system ATPase subunit
LSESIELFEKGDKTVLENINTLMSLSFRQKLSLARVLYADPDIFVFDNIFDGLDIESVSGVLSIFHG